MKFEINAKYLEILEHPHASGYDAIQSVHETFKQQIEEYRRTELDKLSVSIKDKERYNDSQAAETKILLQAMLDEDHPAHSFAAAYIKALSAAQNHATTH